MASSIHPTAAVGFDRCAQQYHRSRPDYPLQAIDFVISICNLGPGSTLLDLGAGTGKFTNLVTKTDARILALEPVPGMRQILSKASSGRVSVIDGTAESIPIASESVDVVVCAQSWHWFDAGCALAEVHRVLRPHGPLVVLYNLKDETVPWIAALERHLSRWKADKPSHIRTRPMFAKQVEQHGGFGPVRQALFPYEHELTPELLVDRVSSQSYIGEMGDGDRSQVLDGVRDLIDQHLVGKATFTMSHLTELSYCYKT